MGKLSYALFVLACLAGSIYLLKIDQFAVVTFNNEMKFLMGSQSSTTDHQRISLPEFCNVFDEKVAVNVPVVADSFVDMMNTQGISTANVRDNNLEEVGEMLGQFEGKVNDLLGDSGTIEGVSDLDIPNMLNDIQRHADGVDLDKMFNDELFQDSNIVNPAEIEKTIGDILKPLDNQDNMNSILDAKNVHNFFDGQIDHREVHNMLNGFQRDVVQEPVKTITEAPRSAPRSELDQMIDELKIKLQYVFSAAEDLIAKLTHSKPVEDKCGEFVFDSEIMEFSIIALFGINFFYVVFVFMGYSFARKFLSMLGVLDLGFGMYVYAFGRNQLLQYNGGFRVELGQSFYMLFVVLLAQTGLMLSELMRSEEEQKQVVRRAGPPAAPVPVQTTVVTQQV